MTPSKKPQGFLTEMDDQLVAVARSVASLAAKASDRLRGSAARLPATGARIEPAVAEPARPAGTVTGSTRRTKTAPPAPDVAGTDVLSAVDKLAEELATLQYRVAATNAGTPFSRTAWVSDGQAVDTDQNHLGR